MSGLAPTSLRTLDTGSPSQGKSPGVWWAPRPSSPKFKDTIHLVLCPTSESSLTFLGWNLPRSKQHFYHVGFWCFKLLETLPNPRLEVHHLSARDLLCIILANNFNVCLLSSPSQTWGCAMLCWQRHCWCGFCAMTLEMNDKLPHTNIHRQM